MRLSFRRPQRQRTLRLVLLVFEEVSVWIQLILL